MSLTRAVSGWGTVGMYWNQRTWTTTFELGQLSSEFKRLYRYPSQTTQVSILSHSVYRECSCNMSPMCCGMHVPYEVLIAKCEQNGV